MEKNTLLHGLKEALHSIQSLKERISKLEQTSFDKWFDYQENRINELEEYINKLTQDGMLLGYKPHKCPVCLGKGELFHGITCTPCEGEGIVWG